MIVETDKEHRSVYFWLGKGEDVDRARTALQPFFQRLKKEKYTAVLFVSGKEDLLETTQALLEANIYNR